MCTVMMCLHDEQEVFSSMILEEFKFLKKNKLLLMVMMVILLIPSIYAGLFLSSMWDPYGDIGNLPVAVVNKDVPVEYNGKNLAVGDSLKTSLENNNTMDFHITDEKTAQSGLEKGDYYMVITIPENFSQNAASVMDKNPQKMELQYTTNPGYNYISSKLSESAVKEIKAGIIAEVTTTYTKAVFASITELGNGFSQAADGTTELLAGMNTLNDGADTLADNMGKLASSSVTLNDGITSLKDGGETYFDGVRQLDSGLSTLNGGVDELADGAARLQSGCHALLDGADTMRSRIDDSLTPANVSQIKMASSSLITMNDNIQKLNAALNGDGGGSNNGSIAMPDMGALTQSVQADLTAAGTNLNNTAVKIQTAMQKLNISPSDPAYSDLMAALGEIQSAGANVQKVGTTLGGLTQYDISGKLDTLKDSVQQLSGASEKLLPASSKAMDSLLTGMQQVQTGLNQTKAKDGQSGLIEGISEINSGIEQINAGIAGKDGLKSGVKSLQDGSAQLVSNGDKLSDGISQLSDGSSQLSDGAIALADGSTSFQDGVTAIIDGTSTLYDALSSGASQVSDSAVTDSNIEMFVEPLTTKETQITTVQNNGHAMAAYMMSVGLWVGCLAFCLMYPLVKCDYTFKNGLSWFAGKAAIVYPTAVIMGMILYMLLHVINGFNPVQSASTMMVSVLSAICFMSIMYFFNALLGKVGSFVMLVFMVLQLAGSAGTYPIEISGSFAAAIHRYVPFTYTVNAFRSTISGGASIGSEVGVLIAITVIFILLTILLFMYRANRIKSGKTVLYSWIEAHGLA